MVEMERVEATHFEANSSSASTPLCLRRSSGCHSSRRSSWETPIPPPSGIAVFKPSADSTESSDVADTSPGCGASLSTNGVEPWNNLDTIAAIGLSLSTQRSPSEPHLDENRFSLESDHIEDSSVIIGLPFEKWVQNLRRKARQRRSTMGSEIGPEREFQGVGPKHATDSRHTKSASGSSLGFVTAIKSASISLASFSIAPRSRRTGISSRNQRTDLSSRASNSGARISEDSVYAAKRKVIDEAVINRSVRRRRVLEEIISTEEGYVGDVRFLMNVYVTLLASVPTLSSSLRSSINKNLVEIVELHEEILGDLHRVVPHSEYNDSERNLPPASEHINGHVRWRSVDAVLENNPDLCRLESAPGMTADASVAAEVAKVFARKVHRFLVYEEYGAKYEIMVKDIASTYRTLPQWETYQKGLETLAAALASVNMQSDQYKKSLTVGDLLVKPIQRVCRYPLLFAELLKQTPVCDCPESHSEIEKVLARLRETTAKINSATDDPRATAIMEKTWILQDRILFPEQVDPRAKNIIRALGHVELCGVLHVAWQTRKGVDNQYMIAMLYRECLLFATTGKADQVYSVQARIRISDMRVEETDNGKGLQCHTAPFSWKLVFECDHQLYEIVLSACSPKEELEWKSRLADRDCREANEIDRLFFTSLSLNISALGSVFGKPGTVARRISIHRATTVGPKSSLCQVIIKNTSAFKDVSGASLTTSINRSQSLLSTNRIPVLTPSRVERVRLENLLSDVWSRDVLPFPGMTGRARSEHLVRASASSILRKLSVASIRSNFTKRSASLVSLASSHHNTDKHHESFEGASETFASLNEQLRFQKKRLAREIEKFPQLAPTSMLSAENLQPQDVVPLAALLNATNMRNAVGTIRRLATRRVKNEDSEEHRPITPPSRSSSANSCGPCTTPPDVGSAFSCHENRSRSKPTGWTIGNGMNIGFGADGIPGVFR